MILGASWNVFDGEELLAGSIAHIRNEVDKVIVVYQTMSHYGLEASPYLLQSLQDYKSMKLIDELVEFNPGVVNEKSHNKRHALEANKRNLGNITARKLGCTHHVSLDTDEYYRYTEFEAAKRVVEEGNHDASAVYITTYHRNPTHRLEGLARFYVPFIHKVGIGIRYQTHTPFFVYADPTRGVTGVDNPILIDSNIITMHHFTLTRNFLWRKFVNHNAKVNFIHTYGEDKYIKEKVQAAYDNVPSSKEFQPYEIVPDEFEVLDLVWDFNYRYGISKDESDVGDLLPVKIVIDRENGRTFNA